MITSQLFSSLGWIYCSCMHVKSVQSCLTLRDPTNCSLSGSWVHGILQARILAWVALPSSKEFSWPGIEPCLLYRLHWQVGSLPLAPSGRPHTVQSVLIAQSCLTLCDPKDCSLPCDSSGKNTRVGCHSLLQGIFPTQGSNPDLLHCRQILYCLNLQGSPVGTPFSP